MEKPSKIHKKVIRERADLLLDRPLAKHKSRFSCETYELPRVCEERDRHVWGRGGSHNSSQIRLAFTPATQQSSNSVQELPRKKESD